MKNYVSAFALLLPLALAGVGSALAAEECSVATLKGTYLFAYNGLTIEGNTRGPFAVAGSDVYDGQGNVREIYTISTNGKIDRNVRIDGEYVVNADCTSTGTFSDGSRYDQFLAPDGSSFVFLGCSTAKRSLTAISHDIGRSNFNRRTHESVRFSLMVSV